MTAALSVFAWQAPLYWLDSQMALSSLSPFCGVKALIPVIHPAAGDGTSMSQCRAHEILMRQTVSERLSLSGDKGLFRVPKFSL